MAIWNGDTWLCDHCDFENAAIRKRCRNCYAPNPGPMHDDPATDAELAKERRANVEVNHAKGIKSEHESRIGCHSHGAR
jgi:hypothetical protein